MECCFWCEGFDFYCEYYDMEWGVLFYDDWVLFELLILEGVQVGLFWVMIFKKCENYCCVFDGFDLVLIVGYGDEKVVGLFVDVGIVWNCVKVVVVIQNVRVYLVFIVGGQLFSDFLW